MATRTPPPPPSPARADHRPPRGPGTGPTTADAPGLPAGGTVVDLLHRPQEPPGRARSLPGRPRLLLRPRPLTGLPTGHGVGVHAVPRRPRATVATPMDSTSYRTMHGLATGHLGRAIGWSGGGATQFPLRGETLADDIFDERIGEQLLVYDTTSRDWSTPLPEAPAGHHPDPVHAQQPPWRPITARTPPPASSTRCSGSTTPGCPTPTPTTRPSSPPSSAPSGHCTSSTRSRTATSGRTCRSCCRNSSWNRACARSCQTPCTACSRAATPYRRWSTP